MDQVAPDVLPFRVALQDEAAFFANRIKQAESSLFSLQSDWRTGIQHFFNTTEYQYINQKIPIQAGTEVQPVLQLFKEMLTALASLPTIDVKLAFLPTREFANRLVNWLDQYGPGAGKVQVKCEPGLIGGITLGYNGHSYDHSLVKRISYAELSSFS